MRDDNDRRDREAREDRDDRRPRRARRRYRDDSDDGSERTASKQVSVLGIIALVKGIFALIASLIPCFGAFAIFAGGLALVLALASVMIARHAKHGMGFPIAATVVSSTAVAFSLMWMAVFGAMFGTADERAVARPVPQVAPVQPVPVPQPMRPVPVPQLKKAPERAPEPKLDNEQVEKQLLEDLAKDRIKEAIRNGPGLPVTAAKLDADYRTNVVAADVKYKDKVLEVTGKAVRVVHDKSKSVYTLELETDEPNKIISLDFTEQTKHPLASVEPGHNVKVRGLCTGRADEVVKLKDCVLVK